jgi:DNA-binding transcriptional regulator YhcF (GntR family)
MSITRLSPTGVDDALRKLESRLGVQWRSGQRLPTVRRLADELSVSAPSAYRAMQRLVHRGYLVSRSRQGVYVSDRFSDERLQSIFAQPGESRTPSVQMLAGRRITLVETPDATHMRRARESVVEALTQAGAQVRLVEYAVAVQNNLVEIPDADVLVMLNPDVMPTIRVPARQHLLLVTSAAGLPRVESPAGGSVGYDVVSVDQEQGGELAGAYLRRLGCTGAAFLGVVRAMPDGTQRLELTSHLRLAGFERGFGQPILAAQQIPAIGYSPFWGAMAAKSYAQMSPRPMGVFAASDDLALGFANGLAALGLELHRDYHLISFDGQRQLQGVPGGVCSVVVPAAAMGRTALDLLLSRLAEPQLPLRKVMLGCELNRPLPDRPVSPA